MGLGSLAALSLFVVLFGLVSEKLRDSSLTPTMAFVTFGLVCGHTLVDLELSSEAVRILAELTLILVLFSDASRIDLRLLLRDHDIPVRLLAIGLPLTIAAGSLAAWLLFPELELWGALALGIVLAPTDAALGQAVVSSERVPTRVRQALNVESGLNDGIALPVLLFAVASAPSSAAAGPDVSDWLGVLARALLLGPLVGGAVAYAGGRAVELAVARGQMSENFEKLSALGLSLFAYGAAELIGGNGFISAFAAGLTLGNTARGRCTRLWAFAEAEGELLVLLTFTVVGALVARPALESTDGWVLLYAFLSLTLVRLLPVAAATAFMGLHARTVGFLGWFGPRGVASILYVLIVLDSELPGRPLILTVCGITVLVSVFAHGLTAAPAARWYGARMAAESATMPEHQEVGSMPV